MESKSKIKVLRIINRFNIGGPTYNATFLTKYLSDQYETLLIGGLPEEGEADSLFVLEKYGVKPLLIEELQRTPNLSADYKAYKKIVEIIKDFKPDIVHTHASKAGMVGRLAAKKCGVPIIIHTFHGHVFHSYFGKFKSLIVQQIEWFLAKLSTKIVVISNIQKEEIVNQFNICKSDKVEVIPLGFDLALFHNDLEVKRTQTRLKYQLQEDEIAIAIVGRLAPIKNHTLFLDAISLVLNQTDKKLRIFIVGDGSEKDKIKKQVEEINQTNNCIVMTSWEKDIATFNAGMEIICLSSDNEGTPVSLIEAQAANIPIVTTNVGGVSDIVKEGETGFIVPKNNSEAFAEKLLLLVENENLRKKMSQNGWAFVEEKFSYKTLVKNMTDLYDKSIEKKKK